MVQAQGVSLVTKIMTSGTVWARAKTGLWCLLTTSRNIRLKLYLQLAGSSPYFTFTDYSPPQQTLLLIFIGYYSLHNSTSQGYFEILSRESLKAG